MQAGCVALVLAWAGLVIEPAGSEALPSESSGELALSAKQINHVQLPGAAVPMLGK